MSIESNGCRSDLAAIHFPGTRIEFWICVESSAGLKTIGPSVIRAFSDNAHRICGAIFAKVVGAHVRCEQAAKGPTQADCISKSAREMSLVLAVRIHL